MLGYVMLMDLPCWLLFRITLGSALFFISLLMPATSSKMSAKWRRAFVCLAVKLKGASLFFSCNAFMKSCAASLTVSPGLLLVSCNLLVKNLLSLLFCSLVFLGCRTCSYCSAFFLDQRTMRLPCDFPSVWCEEYK